MRQSSLLFLAASLVLGSTGGTLRAEMPIGTSPSPTPMPAEHDIALVNEFLEQLVREAIPVEYENNKHWGKTKEVFAGFRIDRGSRWPQFDKRRKTVQHGTWKAYRVRLVDPNNSLHFAIDAPRPAPEGGLRIRIHAVADLEVIGRVAEWCYDVQLFSINAQAIARVQFDATCDIRLQLDPKHSPPDVVLAPVVRDARLEILHFELQRVSQLNGAAAHELGDTLRPVLNEVLEEKRDRIVEKLNRQIARKQDKLRISLHDAARSVWKEAFVMEFTQPVESTESDDQERGDASLNLD